MTCGCSRLVKISGAFGFSTAPFVVLAALALVWLVVYFTRRNAWRREARAELRAIAEEASLEAQWRRLSRLYARLPSDVKSGRRPPQCLYFPDERIGAAEVAAMRDHIRRAAAS